MTMILTADDLKTGDMITIHRGKREECLCGCGSCGPEPYERLKGLPLAVTGIQLPYLAAVVVPLRVNAVIDVRDCELMRSWRSMTSDLCLTNRFRLVRLTP